MRSMSSGTRANVPVLLGVDAAGRVEAWVATRPGCVVFAESESEALRRIPAAVDEYDRRLVRCGLHSIWNDPSVALRASSTNAGTDVWIAERVSVPEALVHGNTAAFFAWDARPAAAHEIDATLHVLSRSRQELLDVVHGLDAARWAQQRPGGGQRTVVDVLRHVANVEWWYVSRIVDFPVPGDGYPDDVETFLLWTRNRVSDRLKKLSAVERARTVVPDPDSGERWSARKVLRRLIYHELYHIRQLRKLVPA